MSSTSRRNFLKGLGAALGTVGVAAASPAVQPGVQAAMTGATESLATQPPVDAPNARQPLTDAALELLAAELLVEWVARRRAFTAYDVTRTLRASRPGYDIPHAPVRLAVHIHMQPELDAGAYRREQRPFATGWAWLYRPLR